MSTPDERPKLTRPPSIDDEKKRLANWASRSPIFHVSTSEIEASQHRRSSAPDSPAGFTHHHEHAARLSMVAPPSSPPSILCSGFFKTTPTKSLGLGFSALSFLSGSKKASPSPKATVISAPFFPTHTNLSELMLSADKDKDHNSSHTAGTSTTNSPISTNNNAAASSASSSDTTRSPTSSISAISGSSGSSSISSNSISSSSISSSISSSSTSNASASSVPISNHDNVFNSAKLGSSSAGPILSHNNPGTVTATTASGGGTGSGAGSLKLSAELALFRKNQYMMNRKISNSDVRK